VESQEEGLPEEAESPELFDDFELALPGSNQMEIDPRDKGKKKCPSETRAGDYLLDDSELTQNMELSQA
jgi:hypothetical protein